LSSISFLGNVMDKYIDFLDRYKYHIIVSITLVVALLSISLRNIAYEGSYRIWFDKDSSIIKDYDKFRSVFGGDDSFIVAFKDENGIFNPKAVEIILDLTDKFKQIDGVTQVNSLSNYQHISSQDDDVYVEDFILSVDDDLKAKQDIALGDRLILNQLISPDGKTTMIAVKLASSTGSKEESNIYVMGEIEKILKPLSEVSGYRFYLSGAPAVTASLVLISQADAMKLMPLAVISVVGLLFLLFRTFLGVLIPSVVVVFTFLSVLSIQMILGYKLNNFTVNIPSFVTAIAIADSMHLYLAWVYYKLRGEDNKTALFVAMKTNVIPITMTSLTTAIGFATLGISPIEPISTLGIAITSGAIIALILSLTIAPAVILTVKDDYKVKKLTFFDLLSTKGYGNFIEKHDKKIVIGFVLLILVSGYGLRYTQIDSNSIKYFKENTIVRSGSNFVEKNLTGSMVYEVILDSKEDEGIKNPEFLNTIEKFESDLKQEFAHIRFSSSLKDIIVRMNEVLNSEKTSDIPNNKNLNAQYLLLYSMSLPQGMEINDKMDTKERFLRLSVYSDIVPTSKDLAMIEWIENYFATKTKYDAEVQGQSAIFAYMQSMISDTLVVSLFMTILLVSLAMYLIFRKLSMLWIFVLPNIAPILIVGGIMGYMGIDVDIGIAISAAVIIGIAVDDTIHFFSKYFEAIKTKNFADTIDYIISHSGNAMILTTFILSITFGVFLVSDFVPNISFAVVTVTALNSALLFDLIFLPAVLSMMNKRRV